MVNKLLQQQDITEPTHSCHRPVWSVKEPNSQWEVIVDYRNINPLSPQIPENLPDVKDVFLKIRNYHPKFFGTIDLKTCPLAYHFMWTLETMLLLPEIINYTESKGSGL